MMPLPAGSFTGQCENVEVIDTNNPSPNRFLFIRNCTDRSVVGRHMCATHLAEAYACIEELRQNLRRYKELQAKAVQA